MALHFYRKGQRSALDDLRPAHVTAVSNTELQKLPDRNPGRFMAVQASMIILYALTIVAAFAIHDATKYTLQLYFGKDNIASMWGYAGAATVLSMLGIFVVARWGRVVRRV
jgi:hypothetical protein